MAMTGTRPLPVIVNFAGGAAAAAGDELSETLRRSFANAGISIALEFRDGANIAEAVVRHAGAPRIVIGGGDGTLRSAAQVLADTPTEMAVLPLGTRNHFARQLGIPMRLEDAAAVAAQGRARALDAGQVGDHLFLNNASMGAYPLLLEERERSVFPKLPASLLAAWRVLRRLKPETLDLKIGEREFSIRTIQVLVGNNRYEIDNGHPGMRRSMTDGVLSVFAVAPLGGLAIVRVGLRIALGKAVTHQDFALDTTVQSMAIGGRGWIAVALDGEHLDLDLPLQFRIRPGALKVVTGESGSATF
jgi:diacylglycerol kinase family enzyme